MQSQKLGDQLAGVTTTGQVVKSARPWVEFPLSCLLAPPSQLLYMSCGEMPWPHPPKMKTQFTFNLQGLMGGLLASQDPSERPLSTALSSSLPELHAAPWKCSASARLLILNW